MTIDSEENLCSLVFIKKGSVLLPAKAETFSIRLSDALKQEVDEIARLSRRSRSFVINEAVSAYVSGRADHLRQLG